ncbi:MAG: peptide chain release factor N(5)-glutamine methyltransferase [Caulobacterales bacterium]
MKISDAIRATRDSLRAAQIDSADLDARLLVEAVSELDRGAILAAPEQELNQAQEALLSEWTQRRARAEPMAYVLGHREFRSLDFVTPHGVLIPRPDTETLIEAALDFAPNARTILDLGVGSGCILLSLLDALPEARGVGVDRSSEALAAAAENARRLGLSGRSRFVASEWGAALSEHFDLVVSNPPYIPTGDIEGLDPDVRNFEPRLALDGGADGLDAYRALAVQAPLLMASGAVALFEIGWDQAGCVSHLLADAGWSKIEVRRDLAGRDRVVLARFK